MDGNGFDVLTRKLASGTSRRSLVRGVLGGAAALFAVKTGASQAAGNVTICHYPPGNPNNVQVLSVGASAVAAHVANHGDTVLGTVASCSSCGDVCKAVDTCTPASCTGGACNTATSCTQYENSYCASGTCACDPTSFEDACAGICDTTASDGCGGTYTCPPCQQECDFCCYGVTTVEGNNVTIDANCNVGCGSLPGAGCDSSDDCGGGYCSGDPLGCEGTFCFSGSDCTVCESISGKSAAPTRPGA